MLSANWKKCFLNEVWKNGLWELVRRCFNLLSVTASLVVSPFLLSSLKFLLFSAFATSMKIFCFNSVLVPFPSFLFSYFPLRSWCVHWLCWISICQEFLSKTSAFLEAWERCHRYLEWNDCCMPKRRSSFCRRRLFAPVESILHRSPHGKGLSSFIHSFFLFSLTQC